MFRFVAALVLVSALVLGYGWLRSVDEREQAEGGGLIGVESAASPTTDPAAEPGAEPEAAPRPFVPVSSLQAPAQAAADGEVQQVLAGLERGEPVAAAAAYRLIREGGDAAAADRLASALDAATRRSPPEAAAALLGTNNSFLHVEEGRRLARQVIERARTQPAEEACQTLTTLLERCMRGPIAKSDLAARQVVDEAYAALRAPLLKTVLNPADQARARSYVVQAGDALERIARRFRKEGLLVDSGTLAAFNRISDPRRLRAGQVIKIPVEPIRTVVEKRSFLQAVYVGETIFRLYWVGLGADDCTPETIFTIDVKKEHPDWYADGRVIPYGHPDNVLGDYFVKFSHASFTGFGAHGTSEPESIGTMASRGCIRMHDADIEDFFKIVPRGTEVEIRANG